MQCSEPVQAVSLVNLDRWQAVNVFMLERCLMFAWMFILVHGVVALCETGVGQLPVELKGSIQRNLFAWPG